MTFVNALNALHGQVLLLFAFLFCVTLLFVRYRKAPANGSIVDSLNSVHIAWLGFALCLCGIALMMASHGPEGDKVFLAGASFIGGIAAAKAVNGSGKPPELPPPTLTT